MANHKKHPPADAAARIEQLAADGWSTRGVAMQLGAHHLIFERWCKEQPELQEALDRGRERERQALHQKLYRMAMGEDKSGNVVGLLFLLKARHGYREGEQSEQANRVSINFTLPGPLKPDQFVIDERKSDPERLPAARTSRS